MSSRDSWYWKRVNPRDGYTKEIINELSHLTIMYEQEDKEWDLSH